MQHCRQNIPTPVTGQLLGLDFAGELEITDSFPLPLKLDEEGEDTGYDHALEMMRYLREVNVDNNTVCFLKPFYKIIPKFSD
jgi:translation initiation factor 3 subunit H